MTMRLEFVSPFLSIHSFPAIDIPDFTVMTGVNGAGKTHLLRAISEGHVKCSVAKDPKTDARFYDWTNLLPKASPNMKNPSAVAAEELAKHAESVRKRHAPKLLDIDKHCGLLAVWPSDRWEIVSATVDQLSIAKFDRDNKNLEASERKQIESAKAQFDKLAGLMDAELKKTIASRPKLMDLVRQIGEALGHPSLLTARALDSLPFRWTQDDLFRQSFGDMFQQYFDLKKQNRKAKIHGDSAYVKDDVFESLHGEPPWDFVNQSLCEAGLDFEISHPRDFSVKKFEPTVSKRSTGATVQFSDLSSGEKVLMCFAFCLYYSTDKRQVVKSPRLLLLDEVDAPLHPSMAKGLVDTIQKHIVGAHGVKVIMSTHSPSTVAVVPPEAVHLMTAGVGLRAVGKRQAISALTAGIPTLSIDFEGRRQVLVESDLDAQRYDRLFYILAPRIASDRSLTFLGVGARAGSGDIGSGSAQVASMVGSLRDAGATSVFGIVDWDGTRQDNESAFVLGHGTQDQRYAIESYLLDPLLVSRALLREDRVAAQRIGFRDRETIFDFDSMDQERLQSLVDALETQLLSGLQSVSQDSDTVAYVGGTQLKVRRHLMRMNGHDLESRVKDVFPSFKRFHQNGAFLRWMIDVVVAEAPQLLPLAVLQCFERILGDVASTGPPEKGLSQASLN